METGIYNNDEKIGVMANLTTTEKGSLVGAVNELNSNTGDLSTLKTTEQSSLVGAINEIKDKLQVVSGTRVIAGNGSTSFPMWTLSEIAQLFGLTTINKEKVIAIFNNGDGNSNGAHIDGAQWYTSSNITRLYATFNANVSGNVRINYILFYIP